jgi:hypothetical protein
MKTLEEFYRLKDGFVEPTRYLGAEVIKWTFPDEVHKPSWGLSSSQYIKEAIRNVESHLSVHNIRLLS